MAAYTTNIAQNPGLQLGLTGYVGLSGATINESARGTSGTLFGNQGLLVNTPGVSSGEGVITPASTVLQTTNHSASVYIQGTTDGNVTVSVVSNPGGTIVGSTPAQLAINSGWQRIVVNNVTALQGNTLSLMITTTMTDAVGFWIANVQIEPEPLAHPYCDGGQPGCQWDSTVGGVSFQLFQNTIEATSTIVDTPVLVQALQLGEVFNAVVNEAFITDRSSLISNSTAPGPQGAMTDFSVASLTDPDPAQTYVSYNNAGLSLPTSGYSRSFGTFIPPQDYFVSGGQQLYSRAAFMAVGFEFDTMPNNQKVTVADVQAEILPFTGGFTTTAPSTYILPRAIETIIKPTRLNYCTNPSFEISTANWTPIGAAVLSQDATVSLGSQVIIDDQASSNFSSMNVAVTNNGDGAQMVLTNLIAGDMYIVSAYIQVNTGIADVVMTCANGSTSVAHGNAGTGYGDLGYGGGFYGGNPALSIPSLYGAGLYGSGLYGTGTVNTIPTGGWARIFTTFTPTDTTATLQITASSPQFATNFWVDGVLVEAGEVLGFYFDGSFGPNYSWETGGTPGLTRSYYYDEFFTKQQAVTNVLEHHVPYGISFTTPQFNIPYTQ